MSCSTSNPLYIEQKNTVNQILIFEDAGNPFDISNFDFYFTAKINITDQDADAVITKDWNTSSDLPNAVLGITKLQLTKMQTDIPSGNYYYDLIYKSPAGEIKTIFKGILTVGDSLPDRI